jgi:hypothetical protein
MSGPLALLGDAIASGTGEWAAIQREREAYERARKDRKADVTDAREYERQVIQGEREYQDGRRKAEWDREQTLYDARRWDALKDQLVRDGLLDPKDLANPEALALAMKKNGPQYERDVKELAEYKAQIPSIILASQGKDTGVGSILTMTVADIESARELMKDVYKDIEAAVAKDVNNKEANARNGALLMMAHNSKLVAIENRKANLESEFERLSTGELNENEVLQVRQMALSKLPELAKKKAPTPDDLALLAGQMAKEEQELRMIATARIQQAARSLDNELRATQNQSDGVRIAMQTGAAAFMGNEAAPAAITGGAPTAQAPAAGGQATSADTLAFADTLGVPAPAATAAPAAATTPVPATQPVTPEAMSGDQSVPAPPTPRPTAAPPAFGGDAVSGGAYSVGQKLASGAAGLAGGAVSAGRGLLSALGSVDSTISKAGPQHVLAGQPSMFEGAQREAEDRILAVAPYSVRAIEIREKRGIPHPVSMQDSAVVRGIPFPFSGP